MASKESYLYWQSNSWKPTPHHMVGDRETVGSVGRFKTFLMLANVSRMICVSPPFPLPPVAIHRFHPIESVLGEVDVQEPPLHLVHLGQTHRQRLYLKS